MHSILSSKIIIVLQKCQQAKFSNLKSLFILNIPEKCLQLSIKTKNYDLICIHLSLIDF